MVAMENGFEHNSCYISISFYIHLDEIHDNMVCTCTRFVMEIKGKHV